VLASPDEPAADSALPPSSDGLLVDPDEQDAAHNAAANSKQAVLGSMSFPQE
jgi:hypothetical protein